MSPIGSCIHTPRHLSVPLFFATPSFRKARLVFSTKTRHLSLSKKGGKRNEKGSLAVTQRASLSRSDSLALSQLDRLVPLNAFDFASVLPFLFLSPLSLCAFFSFLF